MELREQTLPLANEEVETTMNDGQNALEQKGESVMPASEDSGEGGIAVDVASGPLSKERIVELCTELAEKPASEVSRDEVSSLKQQFYAIRKIELAKEKEAFLEKGNEEAAFAPMRDELEEQFKDKLNQIKEKKAALAAEQEAERQRNYERKTAIIDELVAMASDTDNVNRLFPRFKELQQEFKAVGEVPATEVSAQWKNYQEAVERFYDQLKINKDLRDYDFKKNLDVKQLLCTEAEKLADESDVVVAFRRLQDLHEKWRETGPVAKEIREEIWLRFKDASTVINKKYQSFFEERKERERENEVAKTEICERVEAYDLDSLKTFAAWDEMTKMIIAAQEDWKKLGFASKKMNNTLFARFRGTCDRFFALKAEFFKNIKDEMSANLEKKVALCEKAESLKDSTEWKKTSDEFVAMQKEWKSIGAVTKKQGDAVWNRFIAACDYFFEQKKKATSGVRQAEHANLKAKKEIIELLKSISDETPREEAMKSVKDLMERWQQVGHVPFRDKDKVYDAYRSAVNDLYARFDIRESKARFANFENSVNEMSGDENKLYRERERLLRTYEQKRSELHTYENNLGFFNAKSKTGNSMFREIERKIQRIKDDIETLEKKIEVIDSKL